jgi:hypothetical protein
MHGILSVYHIKNLVRTHFSLQSKAKAALSFIERQQIYLPRQGQAAERLVEARRGCLKKWHRLNVRMAELRL